MKRGAGKKVEKTGGVFYFCREITHRMARDKFHQEVRSALEQEGWKITDDPLYLKVGSIPVHIDLGAEMIFGAEKNGEKIAVEIKTFGMPSFVTALHEAVGKYIVYREALKQIKSERELYLAMPFKVYRAYAREPIVSSIFAEYHFKLILYRAKPEKIVSWIR